jgi:ABC-type Mn2+/Zn2+ transport system permease subunit
VVNVLLDPWASGIDRRALVEVLLLAATGGALGCWIVLYNLSYSAESLAHALLPGLVLAALTGLPLLLGGAAGLIVAALAVAAAARLPGLGRDAAVAVVVTPLLGLGALLALSPETPAGLGSLLFGDILAVSDTDLLAATVLALVIVSALAVMHTRLLAVGLDRATAVTLGVRAGRVDAALLVLIALALLVAVQGLGSLLVLAVLVGPAATARALTQRIAPMVTIAIGVAIVAGVGGLYLSYYAGTAAGASIAAILVLTHQAAVVVRRV